MPDGRRRGADEEEADERGHASEELSIEEANALVPTLHRIVSDLMLRKDEIERLVGLLHARVGELPRDLVPRRDDDGDVADLKASVAAALASFEAGWAEVQALGGVVKDPRSGLVDFYGRVNGEPVFLCWRFGEESISHYHGLEEGFSGRKPLPSPGTLHRILN